MTTSMDHRRAVRPARCLAAVLPCVQVLACSQPATPPEVKAAIQDLGSSDPELVAKAFATGANRLNIRFAGEERAALLAALEKGLSARPAAVVGALERDHKGTAVRRYARAMLEDGRGEVIGRQLALVLRAGNAEASPIEVLARAEQRDGAAWFPAAEDAGFFAGAVAWALANVPDPASAAAAIAAGMKVRPRMETETWSEWLRAVSLADGATGARLSEPASNEFEGAFRTSDPEP